jgi:cation:H+ antiporter
MQGTVWVDIAWAGGALVVILGACELFTNGVEWFGKTLNLSEGVVGSVLAAVGTALPETIVPLVAILLIGGESGREVGIGGILGAPFMLGTLAFFVTGLCVFVCARRRPQGTRMIVDADALKWDVGAFIVAYSVGIAASWLPHHWEKVLVAVALLIAYPLYVRRHFGAEPGEGHGLELRRLYFCSRNRDCAPHLWQTAVQTLVALGGILIGARVFVGRLTELCEALGADPRILALIVVPIATELPEKLNSVIWIRQGKDTLAVGNITGAMVFQGCMPVSVGLLFTAWRFRPADLTSALVALASATLLLGSLLWKRRLSPWVLLCGLLGYLVFLLVVIT